MIFKDRVCNLLTINGRYSLLSITTFNDPLDHNYLAYYYYYNKLNINTLFIGIGKQLDDTKVYFYTV